MNISVTTVCIFERIKYFPLSNILTYCYYEAPGIRIFVVLISYICRLFKIRLLTGSLKSIRLQLISFLVSIMKNDIFQQYLRIECQKFVLAVRKNRWKPENIVKNSEEENNVFKYIAIQFHWSISFILQLNFLVESCPYTLNTFLIILNLWWELIFSCSHPPLSRRSRILYFIVSQDNLYSTGHLFAIILLQLVMFYEKPEEFLL